MSDARWFAFPEHWKGPGPGAEASARHSPRSHSFLVATAGAQALASLQAVARTQASRAMEVALDAFELEYQSFVGHKVFDRELWFVSKGFLLPDEPILAVATGKSGSTVERLFVSPTIIVKVNFGRDFTGDFASLTQVASPTMQSKWNGVELVVPTDRGPFSLSKVAKDEAINFIDRLQLIRAQVDPSGYPVECLPALHEVQKFLTLMRTLIPRENLILDDPDDPETVPGIEAVMACQAAIDTGPPSYAQACILEYLVSLGGAARYEEGNRLRGVMVSLFGEMFEEGDSFLEVGEWKKGDGSAFRDAVMAVLQQGARVTLATAELARPQLLAQQRQRAHDRQKTVDSMAKNAPLGQSSAPEVAATPGPPETAQAEMADARPPSPPEGWYPDPHGSGRSRFWDGSAWTEAVSES